MDILGIKRSSRVTDLLDSLRSLGIRWLFVVLAAVVAWDLATKYMAGPTLNHFYPRLYLWLFFGLMALLVWSILRSLRLWRWRLAFGLIVVLAGVLTVADTPESFPFLAPGQERTVEGRKLLVKPISVEVLGLEVRPGSLDNWIDAKMRWMVRQWRDFFQGITNALLKVLVPLERALLDMPWWLFIGSVVLVSWKISGQRIAMIALGGLVFIGVFGYWASAMRTVAVVGTATAMSVALAIPVGILMAKSNWFQAAMRPILDLMQVMPTFVYLIPVIFFLGLGKVPAVIATMVYAMPPAMRLTNLGIRLVSPDLVEAARAFGTTPWQLLIKIQLPLARPTIMAGVNQTVMMALAMVVLASMVGSQGLGADVLAGIAQLEVGRGLMGGIGIVILAIIIDRTSQGLAKDPRAQRSS